MINWKYEEPKKRTLTRGVIWGADIIEGHPVTDNDSSLIDELPSETREKVFSWIRQSILPATCINKYRTSYDIKHLLQHETGIYLTNNQFKDAMLLCGFLPTNRKKLNWTYRIKERSPVFVRERERNYGGVIKN